MNLGFPGDVFRFAPLGRKPGRVRLSVVSRATKTRPVLSGRNASDRDQQSHETDDPTHEIPLRFVAHAARVRPIVDSFDVVTERIAREPHAPQRRVTIVRNFARVLNGSTTVAALERLAKSLLRDSCGGDMAVPVDVEQRQAHLLRRRTMLGATGDFKRPLNELDSAGSTTTK